MSSTWATRLAADDGHNLRLYITIQGLPNVFQEDATDVPTVLEAAARPRTKLVTKIEQSETRLNLATRRVEGGQLTMRLTDDDAGTLAALFKPRALRTTFLNATVSAIAGAIPVVNSSALPAAGTVYVEGETITYTSKIAGPTLSGATRGVFNSEAQSHLADATDGADVFLAPPSWTGRRLYLKAYFLNDDGTTTAALSTTLATMRLAAAPKHLGDDEWEITATDLVEEFGTKKIGGGIVDVQIDQAVQTLHTPVDGTFDLVVGAGFNFNQFVVGGVQTFVMVDPGINADKWFYPLVAQVSTNAISYDTQGPDGHGHFDQVPIKQIRHMAFLSGDPGPVALQVITSRLGNAANGANDVLPGYDAATYGETAWRMGAGLLAADVDTAAFSSATILGGGSWSFIIDDELDLADFLFELCLTTGTAWISNRLGQLSLVSLAEDGSTSVMTIDDKIVDASEAVTLLYDEDAVYPRVRLQCNYDPRLKDYRVTENTFDVKLQKRFPNREASLELKSKSLVLEDAVASGFGTVMRPTLTQGALQGMLRRIQAGEGRGRAYVKAACHLPVLAAQLGNTVTLNNIRVPDAEGNVLLANHPARVVAMRPRHDDALVDVTFQLLDKLYSVAPAAIIASANGAGVGPILTLQTTGPETASALPGRMFADNTSVQIWDVSTATKVTRTIVSHTDTTITISSVLPAAVQNGVDFVRLDRQTASIDFTSQDGFTGLSFLFQMPDDENDGTAREITRWR